MYKALLFCFVLSATSVFSQGLKFRHLTLTEGKTFSTFLFENSEAMQDPNLGPVLLNTFGMNGIFSNGKHIIRPEFLFRQGGAQSSVKSTSVSWRLNYMDLNLGYIYSPFDSKRVSISPGIAFGLSYMVNGEQLIGTTRYSILETGALSRIDLNLMGICRIKTQITENIDLSLEYRCGYGLIQIERDETAQKTHNFYQSALLGIGFKIH